MEDNKEDNNNNNNKINIKYLGHAFFKVSSGELSATFDPVDEESGYRFNEKIKTNLSLISHYHHDHCNENILDVNSVNNFTKEKNVKVIKSYHDDCNGAKRGNNDINVLTINGFKVCHLGDLGHLLNDKQIEEIGDIDILFIPVGGIYTIDGKRALELLDKINTKVIIPMHYKTEKLTFELESEEDFTRLTRRHHEVIVLNMNEVTFTRKELDNFSYDDKKVYVLKA